MSVIRLVIWMIASAIGFVFSIILVLLNHLYITAAIIAAAWWLGLFPGHWGRFW